MEVVFYLFIIFSILNLEMFPPSVSSTLSVGSSKYIMSVFEKKDENTPAQRMGITERVHT